MGESQRDSPSDGGEICEADVCIDDFGLPDRDARI
jgi:hypothetical protein